jgi:hypothetical protein
MPERDRRLAFAFLVATAAWSIGLALLGSTTGVLFCVPAVLLAIPLAFHRFLGEKLLGAARERFAPPRPRAPRTLPIPSAARRFVVLPRSGRLIAASLANRPPPPSPLLT